MGIIKPLPRALALTRLKSNLFLLFLFTVIRTVFTPYTSIRGGLIWLIDDRIGLGGSDTLFKVLEWIVSAVLGFNALEAAHNIYYPRAVSVPNTQIGRVFIPSKPSSPLTRPAPRISDPRTQSTPSKEGSAQTPSRQQITSSSSNYGTSTPTRSSALAQQHTPGSAHRSSPLSSSTTADILNLPRQGTPSKTGLYFDDGDAASTAQGSGAGAGAGPGGEFVMVDREEREWVENVWKGVRGKGGRVPVDL